ncbi:hypothetical protein ACN261_08150 [Micromonospora sp. WMMD723]
MRIFACDSNNAALARTASLAIFLNTWMEVSAVVTGLASPILS